MFKASDKPLLVTQRLCTFTTQQSYVENNKTCFRIDRDLCAPSLPQYTALGCSILFTMYFGRLHHSSHFRGPMCSNALAILYGKCLSLCPTSRLKAGVGFGAAVFGLKKGVCCLGLCLNVRQDKKLSWCQGWSRCRGVNGFLSRPLFPFIWPFFSRF